MATTMVRGKRSTGAKVYGVLVEVILFLLVSTLASLWTMIALGNAHAAWSSAIPAPGFFDVFTVVIFLHLAAASVIRLVTTEEPRR